MARHLWLVGMMGSGKSTVGRLMADRLGVEFVDSDDEVVNRVGSSIADFWSEQGEAAFRDVEAAVIEYLAAGPDRVIASGGGAVLRTANVLHMRRTGLVIWLQADEETLLDRVGSADRRPLLRNKDAAATLHTLLTDRADAYRLAAHHSVATDGLELDTVATRIEELWNAY